MVGAVVVVVLLVLLPPPPPPPPPPLLDGFVFVKVLFSELPVFPKSSVHCTFHWCVLYVVSVCCLVVIVLFIVDMFAALFPSIDSSHVMFPSSASVVVHLKLVVSPLNVLPFVGAVNVTFGAFASVVLVMLALFVFPASSVACTVIVCVPSVSVRFTSSAVLFALLPFVLLTESISIS